MHQFPFHVRPSCSKGAGVDPGLFKEEVGGRGVVVAESMGHVPKMLQFENWNRTENHYTRNTSNAAK